MSPDMTIESALADPVIRAVMRADKVEPKFLERFLRSAALGLDPASLARPEPPATSSQSWCSSIARGLCCA